MKDKSHIKHFEKQRIFTTIILVNNDKTFYREILPTVLPTVYRNQKQVHARDVTRINIIQHISTVLNMLVTLT